MTEPQKLEITVRKEKEPQNTPETDDIGQLKAELESEKSLREDYEAKLELIAKQKIENEIARLNIPKEEADYFRQYPEGLKGYSLGKNQTKEGSGKGSIPMTSDMLAKEHGSSGNEKREFSDVESMLEFCRVHDKSAYEAIKNKAYSGLLENKNFFEWKDEFDANGKSLIGRTIERMNAQARAKSGLKD